MCVCVCVDLEIYLPRDLCWECVQQSTSITTRAKVKFGLRSSRDRALEFAIQGFGLQVTQWHRDEVQGGARQPSSCSRLLTQVTQPTYIGISHINTDNGSTILAGKNWAGRDLGAREGSRVDGV
jgi:hypothetical protein